MGSSDGDVCCIVALLLAGNALVHDKFRSLTSNVNPPETFILKKGLYVAFHSRTSLPVYLSMEDNGEINY